MIFVVPNLAAGGAERVVSILSKEFILSGLEVAIVLMSDNVIQYNIAEKVEIVKLNTTGLSRIKRLQTMRAYFKVEKKKNKKIVVIPFLDSCLKNTLMALGGLSIPVIASERNNPYLKGNKKIEKMVANLPYFLADHCVFQTEGARDYYCSAVKRKSCVIANPISIDPKIKWHGWENQKIVSVGRLEPQKNQKMLIDAFAEFHKEFPEYILEIYGEGSLRLDLQKQIAEKNLETRVFLCGYEKEVLKKIAAASAFVMSSDYEGMSNALIEALAIGMPVVSTDHPIGGARALIANGENGFLTPVGDSIALSNAMKRIVGNIEDTKQMSENALKIKDLLAANKVAKEWIDLIQKIHLS